MMINKNKINYIGASISIFVNLILAALKYWAGIVSGSVALIADAWHTLSDSLSSIIVIAGVKLSSKKPDKKHPFGHGRWEHIAAIFIGIFLAIVAYEFLSTAIDKLQNRELANFGRIAIIVTIISIILKEALAQMSFYIAKVSENTAMKADAWHHRSDALSSVVVLVGIFLQQYFWWVDAILGIIIALILFYAVFGIIKDAISKIIGEEISDELKKKVIQIISDKYGHDLGVHHFHIHNYGRHKELSFHIFLNPDLSVAESHSITLWIEKEIKKQLFVTTTIHVEPKTNDEVL